MNHILRGKLEDIINKSNKSSLDISGHNLSQLISIV